MKHISLFTYSWRRKVMKDSKFSFLLSYKCSKKGKATTYFITPISFAEVRRLKTVGENFLCHYTAPPQEAQACQYIVFHLQL